MTENETIIKAVERHFSEISSLLGIPITDSNKDTPSRVAKMYCSELFKNRNNLTIETLNQQMTLFPAMSKGQIEIKDIEFWSTCEHHWLPFGGTCSVKYIPDKQIIGLSKVPRVVKYFSQKPQLQENLTQEIGEYLINTIKPVSLSVEMTAKHSCVMCRGAESNCQTVTVFNYSRGVAE